jgi:VWFA-related protein
MAQRQDTAGNRLDDAARAGWLYYVAGNNQEQIARKLGVSRQTAQRLVSLSVSVTDRANHYVAYLEQQDFTIFEEGAPQSVTYFRKSEAPLVLTLLLDSSSSMQLKLPTAQRAAIGFVEQLTPADAASVLQFGTRVTTLQALTRDRAALVNAIRRSAADAAFRLAAPTAGCGTGSFAPTPITWSRMSSSMASPTWSHWLPSAELR